MRRRLTDGGDEGGVEGVLAEPEQQAGLADAAVPDEQQLEQVVVRLRHFPAVGPSVCPGEFTRNLRPAPFLLGGLASLGALVSCWFHSESSDKQQEALRLQASRNLPRPHPVPFFHNKASLSQRAPLLMIVTNYNISHV